LLFTAPHSGKLKRGGEEYYQDKRIHLREKFTAVLAMKFAIEIEKVSATKKIGSLCVWSKDHKLNEVD